MSDRNGLKVVSTYRFSPELREILAEAAQTEFVDVTRVEDFLALLPQAEILCAYMVPDNLRALAPNLRWLQYPGAGIDGLQPTGLLDADSAVKITTAAGIHVTTISEYVFGSMLMFNRSWPEMVRLQDRRMWARNAGWHHLRQRELVDQTLGIVGLGNIGRRVAQLGRAFGMKVLATKRSANPEQADPDVDRLYSTEQLHELLSLSDYVVLTVPLTRDTEKMIGEAELRAMRRDAYLVNVGRGRVIDEEALIRALSEGWIAGAGLDVTAEEPLPAESPLYALPNVILTPHISGESTYYAERLAKLFAENLRLYRTGQPLRNQYDPERGY